MTEQQHLAALRRELEFMREHIRICYAAIAILTMVALWSVANLILQVAL